MCVPLIVCMYWVLVSVRMFHLLATACQDCHLSSGDPSMYTLFVLVFVSVTVCVYALGPCVCQDVSSFGNSLSRCVIFRQVTRPCIHCCFSHCVRHCVCVYALGPCVCQDVSSFGNSLSRCVIFRQVTRPCIHCLF